MRSECAWSMSTVGLTAQEISFPIENPFLRGSYCHSMAGSKSSWNHRHELNNFYFTMNSSHTDHSPPTHHKGPPPSSLSYDRYKSGSQTQRLPSKKSRPHLSLPFSAEPSTPSPVDDDQVVPSFQRLSVYECSSPPQTPDRCSKPLPPIPPHRDASLEQAVDSEVEFFTNTDDSCCLVSDQYTKTSLFRYGLLSRRSFRDCGKINYAYFDGPQTHKQPEQQQQHRTHPQKEVQEQYEQQQHHQHQQQQRRERPEPAACQRLQDKAQRKLQRSHSGPAGSLNKPSLLRLSCSKRHTHSMDKPEVPPPPPIPPRMKTGDYRRWSAEVSSGAYSDDDRPPKVPPREPLSTGSSPRTPSPKSLPTYVNGVMPPTQSFAPDPKYVRCRGLHRQNSECSPCILPVMEGGEKVSNTHYYLLDKCALPNTDVSDSHWDSHTRRNVDLV